MKILVTGGIGFVGSHIANKLFEQNHHVVILDSFGETSCTNRLKHSEISLIKGSIADDSIWDEMDEDFDMVINAAAETHVDHSFKNPTQFINTNIIGLHNVAKFCAQNTIKLIHLSTDEVIGTGKPMTEESMLLPTNPYAATKVAGEAIIHAYGYSYGLKWNIFRLNNIYGTMQFPDKLIPFFINQLNDDKMLPIHGDGTQIRYFLHVDDFVDAILTVLEKGSLNHIYNVSSNESYSVLDIAHMICEEMGKNTEDSITFTKNRLFQDPIYLSKSDKLRALGWTPKHSLKSTLPHLINWYKGHLNFFNCFEHAV